MQLKRNSSHKPGTNSSDFFFFDLLLHGTQDGFVFSFRKKETHFHFQLENILRLSEGMKMIFKKSLYLMHYDSKEDIQLDIIDGCQFCL